MRLLGHERVHVRCEAQRQGSPLQVLQGIGAPEELQHLGDAFPAAVSGHRAPKLHHVRKETEKTEQQTTVHMLPKSEHAGQGGLFVNHEDALSENIQQAVAHILSVFLAEARSGTRRRRGIRGKR